MKIKLGTRNSRIPLLQARVVEQLLTNAGAEVEVLPIDTIGDTLGVTAEGRESARIFTSEIDDALGHGVRVLGLMSSNRGPPGARNKAMLMARAPSVRSNTPLKSEAPRLSRR